jgi:microcin C transport system permease protein
VLFVLSLFAEFIANDKPIVVSYRGELRMPIFQFYSERSFGGDFPPRPPTATWRCAA